MTTVSSEAIGDEAGGDLKHSLADCARFTQDHVYSSRRARRSWVGRPGHYLALYLPPIHLPAPACSQISATLVTEKKRAWGLDRGGKPASKRSAEVFEARDWYFAQETSRRTRKYDERIESLCFLHVPRLSFEKWHFPPMWTFANLARQNIWQNIHTHTLTHTPELSSLEKERNTKRYCEDKKIWTNRKGRTTEWRWRYSLTSCH